MDEMDAISYVILISSYWALFIELKDVTVSIKYNINLFKSQ